MRAAGQVQLLLADFRYLPGGYFTCGVASKTYFGNFTPLYRHSRGLTLSLPTVAAAAPPSLE